MHLLYLGKFTSRKRKRQRVRLKKRFSRKNKSSKGKKIIQYAMKRRRRNRYAAKDMM